MSSHNPEGVKFLVDTIAAGKAVVIWSDQMEAMSPPCYQDLKSIIGCDMIQVVPCTQGDLAGIAYIVCDDEGIMNGRSSNPLANELVGCQVCGSLLGPIVVKPMDNGSDNDDSDDSDNSDDE